MASKVFVTLFRNDGRLEASLAKPFYLLEHWPLAEAASQCHMRLYGVPNPGARLFTDMGVEIDDISFVAAQQPLVVSGGEPFARVVHAMKSAAMASPVPDTAVPNPAQQLAELERLIQAAYEQQAAAPPINMQDVLSQLEMDLAGANLPHVASFTAAAAANHSNGGETFGASMENGGGDFQSLFESLQFPTASFEVPMVPVAPVDHAPVPGVGHVSYNYDGSPIPGVPSPHGSSSPPTSPDGSMPTPPGSTGMGAQAEARGGVADRMSSHKASEQRSREKLKQSIQELVLSIPTLSNMRNPSKATIIKKATDFVNHAKKTNSALLSENQRARQMVQEAQRESLSLQKRVQISSIMTVEITDLEMRYIFVDHMWEIVMGYQRHEVVGRVLKEVVGCPKCPLMVRRAAEIQRNIENGTTWRGVILGRRRDGRPFACEATIDPITDAKGNIFQYICTRKNFHVLTAKEATAVCQSLATAEKMAGELAVGFSADADRLRVQAALGIDDSNSMPGAMEVS